MTHLLALELQLRSAGIDQNTLLESMGYHHPSGQARKRLADAIGHPAKFLEGSSFDFKYSSEAFLRRLGTLLGLEADWLEEQLEDLKADNHAEASAFKPYLFVDTGFVRQAQPIFALALCSHQRYLSFAPGFWRLPVHEQVVQAQERVRGHMAETGGDLRIWGQVLRYVFHYAPDSHIVIDPRGELSAALARPFAIANFQKPIRGLERILPMADCEDA
jgi:hypothetical protein